MQRPTLVGKVDIFNDCPLDDAMPVVAKLDAIHAVETVQLANSRPVFPRRLVIDFQFPPKMLLNVNVPALDDEDILGVAITELGRKMFTDNYEKRIDPRGKVYYWMAGELISEPSTANTDIAAVRNNKISITPVTFEMTRKETMSDLEGILCQGDSCDWI